MGFSSLSRPLRRPSHGMNLYDLQASTNSVGRCSVNKRKEVVQKGGYYFGSVVNARRSR